MWKQLDKQSSGEIKIIFCSESRSGMQAIVSSINHSSILANRSLYENSFAVNGARMERTGQLDNNNRFRDYF